MLTGGRKMAKQDFIAELSALYGSYCGFGVYDSGEGCETIVLSNDIKIVFTSDYQCDIWRVFCYMHKDFDEDFDHGLLERIEGDTKRKLLDIFHKEPVEEFEDGMGCPADDVLVGYRGIEFDIDIVSRFVNACIEANSAIHKA